MTEFRLIIHPEFRAQFVEFRRVAASNDRSIGARTARAGIIAMKALREGRERDFRGERLGYSSRHHDLRDCAEIKIDVLDERTADRRPLGPSHRLIYREFEPAADDPRPIRQIIAFEHRKDGKPFQVAAERLDRRKGLAIPELTDLANTMPATGHDKDPTRATGPSRLPLPPDLAAALSTAQQAKPSREQSRPPDRRTRPTDPPTPNHSRDR